MQPIPTHPWKRRAQGGLTRSGAYPPNLFFQRGGLVLPLPDLVRDRITPPGVEEARSTRRSAVAPTLTATRQDGHTSGHDVGAAEKDGPPHPEEEEEEETHPMPIKDVQTTPEGIADPPQDHDGSAFTQRVGFGRQRCLTIV